MCPLFSSVIHEKRFVFFFFFCPIPVIFEDELIPDAFPLETPTLSIKSILPFSVFGRVLL